MRLDNLLKVATPVETGVQRIYTHLKRLDSAPDQVRGSPE